MNSRFFGWVFSTRFPGFFGLTIVSSVAYALPNFAACNRFIHDGVRDADLPAEDLQ